MPGEVSQRRLAGGSNERRRTLQKDGAPEPITGCLGSGKRLFGHLLGFDPQQPRHLTRMRGEQGVGP